MHPKGTTAGCTLAAQHEHEAAFLNSTDVDFTATDTALEHPCSTLEKVEFGCWSFSLLFFGMGCFLSMILIGLIMVQPDDRSLYAMLREKRYYNMMLMVPAQMNTYGFLSMLTGFMLRRWHQSHMHIAMASTVIFSVGIVLIFLWIFWIFQVFMNVSFWTAIHTFLVTWGFVPYPPSMATHGIQTNKPDPDGVDEVAIVPRLATHSEGVALPNGTPKKGPGRLSRSTIIPSVTYRRVKVGMQEPEPTVMNPTTSSHTHTHATGD